MDVSPQNIRKIKNYNSKSYEEIVKESFKELVPDWLMEPFEPDFFQRDYYRNDDIEPFCWCPIKFKGNDDDYTLYYTLVNKIDYYETLFKLSDSMPNKVRQAIRALQDQFIMLTLYMEINSAYRNTDLMFSLTDTEIPPYVIFKPDLDKIFDIEEIPDMFIHCVYCQFWGNGMDSPYQMGKEDSEVKKLISLLSKCLPYPCKGRSVTTILPSAWLDGEEQGSKIFDLIVRIIFGSLLGIYPHCTQFANFRTRRHYYKWFSFNKPTKESITNLISSNKFFIIYIMREFLFFCMQNVPSLNDFHRKNYYWDLIVTNTFTSTDEMRNTINYHFLYYTEHTMNDADAIVDEDMWDYFLHLNGQHGSTEEDFYTRSEENYAEAMRHIEKSKGRKAPINVNHKNYLWFPGLPLFKGVDKLLEGSNRVNLDRCNRPTDMSFLDKTVSVLKSVNDKNFRNKRQSLLSEEVKDCILKLVDAYDQDLHSSNPYNHLSFYPICMSGESSKMLKEAELQYVRETDRSDIDYVIETIYKQYPRDYEIINMYFNLLEKKKSIVIYELPLSMIKQQIDSISRILQIIPGQEIPKEVGLYYICKNCTKLKTLVFPYGPHNKKKYGSFCSTGVCIDFETGEKTCAKASSKNLPKNRSGQADFLSEIIGITPDEEKETKKAAKLHRRNSLMNSCPHTKLDPIDMIGRMVIGKNGPIIKCPKCMTVTTLSRYNYANSGGQFSCGCYTDPLSVKYFNCCICDASTNKPGLKLIFDDSPDKQRVEMKVFCKKHFPNWMHEWEEFLVLSTLKEVFKKGWFAIKLSNGSRVFIDPDDSRLKDNKKYTPSNKKLKVSLQNDYRWSED